MRHNTRGSGQPLIFVITLLTVWTAARMGAHIDIAKPQVPGDIFTLPALPSGPFAVIGASAHASTLQPVVWTKTATPIQATRADTAPHLAALLTRAHDLPDDFDVSAAHHQLYAMAMGYPAVALSTGYAVPIAPAPQRSQTSVSGFQPTLIPAPPSSRAKPDRWSVYGWAFYRSGEAASAIGSGAQYGGSQSGAILRYKLAPGSHASRNAYARLSSAHNGPAQRELAIGVTDRPLSGVPVALAVERRINLGHGGRNAFSVYANTQIAPQKLPQGFAGEVYAQAGWVSGSNGIAATGFYDVQASATRTVAQSQDADLAVGGGVWAGGQRGARRLDLGPRLVARLPLAAGNARLSLDARQRVAGDALPASGLALTLSAEF